METDTTIISIDGTFFIRQTWASYVDFLINNMFMVKNKPHQISAARVQISAAYARFWVQFPVLLYEMDNYVRE